MRRLMLRDALRAPQHEADKLSIVVPAKAGVIVLCVRERLGLISVTPRRKE
jgi:hypothetical protein